MQSINRKPRINILFFLIALFVLLSFISMRHENRLALAYIITLFLLFCGFMIFARISIAKKIPFRVTRNDLLILGLLIFSLFHSTIFLSSNDLYLMLGDFFPFAVFGFTYFCFRIYNQYSKANFSLKSIMNILLVLYVIIGSTILVDAFVFGGSIFSISRIGGLVIPRIMPGFIPEIMFFLFFLRVLSGKGILNYVGLIISIILIFLSLSRALWIGIATVILVLIYFFWKETRLQYLRKRLILMMTIVAILLVPANYFIQLRLGIGISDIINSRIKSISNLSVANANQARIYEVKDGLIVFLNNPWGIGLGGKYYTYAPNGEYSFINYIHNSYIEILVKMGFIGLGIFLAIYISFLRRAIFYFKRTGSLDAFGIYLGIIAMMVATNFSPSLNKIQPAFYLGFIFAALETSFLSLYANQPNKNDGQRL